MNRKEEMKKLEKLEKEMEKMNAKISEMTKTMEMIINE